MKDPIKECEKDLMDSVPGHVRGRYVPPRSTGRPTTANGRNKSPDPWLAGKAPVSTTALAISKDPSRVSRLSFGCPHLDDAFGGGVPVQGITEIAGEAGAGKTQLSLQLLLQAQLPRDRGGLGGKSYALSCGEGNFPSRRLRQMAERYQGDGMDAAKMMEGVCIQTARNLEEQLIILMEHLPRLMESHGIKLVVVDSISALFRGDLGSGRSYVSERSCLIWRMAQQMKRLGDKYTAAFVVVNQVTAQFRSPGSTPGQTRAPGRSLSPGGGGSSGAVGGGVGSKPALGLLWSSCVNTRFMVRRGEVSVPLPPNAGGWDGGAIGSDDRGGRAGSREAPAGISQGRGGRPTDGTACGGDGMEGEVRGTGRSPPSLVVVREVSLELSAVLAVPRACGFVLSVVGVRGIGDGPYLRERKSDG